MAIVQISRITNRKGLEADLPQPLAGAELGWAIDERRLYIGNGDLAEGAPVVGNTEILTEFSNILEFSTSYTYKGEAGGYVVQTGPTPGSPVTQSLQRRLDSYAIVTDFGAIGDGVTDCTEAINRALYQLYCIDNNPATRRSLFFPAGVYIVTSTLLIPPYATLYGEGINNSIVSLFVQEWTGTVAYDQGVLVRVENTYYRSLIPVPVGVSISNNVYWALDIEPPCIVRTTDSLQQTDINIGVNGAIAPQSVTISNMQFSTNLEINGLLIENAADCEFSRVRFSGGLTQQIIEDYALSPVTTAGDFIIGQIYEIVTLGDTDWNAAAGTTGVTYIVGDQFTAATVGLGTGEADLIPTPTCGIAWASTPALPCTNVTVTGCEFDGFWFGTATDQYVKGVTVSNSLFNTLYRGVYLGGAVVEDGGATGFKVLHNTFDTIYHQGVLFEQVSLNATGYNIFYDVGNGFNGYDYPETACVEFDTANNVSVGDMFARSDLVVDTSGLPRIEINNTASIATTNGNELALGTYTRFSGLQEVLPNNSSATELFSVNALTVRAFNFDYTVTRGAATRTGVFTVVASTDGSGTDLVYNDSGFQNVVNGVTFSVSETASVVSVFYETTNDGNDAVLNYSVTKLA